NTSDSYIRVKAVAGSEQPEESCGHPDDEIDLLSSSLDRTPFVPTDARHRNENCSEIISIQCHGLLQRLRAIGCPKMVIGVSGGLDSTLALLVAVRTALMAGMSSNDVIGITMPGLATTNRTHDNAWHLMELLGCTAIEIPIGKAVAQHFSDIGQNPELYDATYENSQARERTQILMDYANKAGGIVIGTGDLSELALGWCTYNGDHMSMYAVNTSVPKTLVKYLVEWFALQEKNEDIRRILFDIIDTPISPELVPAKEGKDEIEQKTEDLVGPYELHDYFLFHTLRNAFSPKKIYYLAREAFRGVYDESVILHWLKIFYRRFFNQQFKRSCLPDGPKVGSVCLSPRGDWRMPSDASSYLWQKELEDL
ncbi:MAG: NAD(+) synthase, partial [Muribaculaceae bacterium]|nr:NAD(+) synthase [Muribaculaceae bacterium]